MNNKSKTPWPTKAVMQQIYEQQLWGTDGSNFYSGEGSHEEHITKPYIEAVLNFLKSHDEELTVCDLGCGDFNIGQHFVGRTKYYYAIDIVNKLIERNKQLFKAENLEFQCLDISIDDLPKADCIILRQVLQHLSNSEIQDILKKLSDYKYIILTEHIPVGYFEPNKDKIASQGIRLKQNSGVDILAEPFNFKAIEHTVLNEVVLGEKDGRIVTMLFIL